MTTALDLRIPGRVKSIIDRLGAAATLTQRADGYDLTKGTNEGGSVGHAVKATPPAPFRRGFEAGSSVVGAALSTFVAANGLSVEPRSGDLFSLGSRTYRVVAVLPIHSGDAVAAYELELAT